MAEDVKTVSTLDGLERKAIKKKLNKAKRMREEGNVAVESNNFVKAIELYSEVLLIDGLPIEEKSLLHSNRSYAYLETAMVKLQSRDEVIKNQELAMHDAEEVMKLRPTWWKGYFRAGLVYQFKSEWEQAIDMFDQCLALSPHLVDVANCRDECRYDQCRVEIYCYINSRLRPYSFNEQIHKLSKERGLNAEEITRKYEQFMDSKNQKDRALACVFFGYLYVQGIDGPQVYKKGAELFQEAVEAGLPEAMSALGLLYMEGNGVTRNIPKAVTLFEKASECEPQTNNNGLDEFVAGALNFGISHGQFQIGKCYQDGTGKPLDLYQAYQWYKKASDGGHAGAANNIGILYHFGRGVEKCAIKAKQYWSLAASRGNELAMDFLAWTFLQDRDFEQAKTWYSRAIEAGNINSIQHKDTFYGILEEARNGMEELDGLFPGLATIGETFDEIKSDEGNKFTPEIAKLIEACSRLSKPPSITDCTALTDSDSPLVKYWSHLEEISKRASDGHPYAQTLLTSMSYFSQAWECLQDLCAKKIKPADIEIAREQCILNLANCFRATEIVAYFYPAQLPELKKMCGDKMTSEKSELDLAARIVNSVLLSYSPNSEILSMSKINILKYPEEVFFYKVYAGSLAVRQNYVASMKVSDDGLKCHPRNSSLLYCKAGAMKMIHPSSTDKIIAAYKEFIQEAPFDERSIPEAYYNMAFHCLGNGKGKAKSKNKSDNNADTEAISYYWQGMEAEEKLLPCFVPCDSNVKGILEALLSYVTKKNP